MSLIAMRHAGEIGARPRVEESKRQPNCAIPVEPAYTLASFRPSSASAQPWKLQRVNTTTSRVTVSGDARAADGASSASRPGLPLPDGRAPPSLISAAAAYHRLAASIAPPVVGHGSTTTVPAVLSAASIPASFSSNYAVAVSADGSPLSDPVNNTAPDMTRSSAVSEEVWAKAIHAVKVQKMSLRQAAQLYGVHHMSLHRRVRGRYSSSPSSDIHNFLSADDEAEVLGVLREQFLHEKRITSDDIRFVVRAIASQGGKRSIPPEFPPSSWIMDFKRSHGFAKLNSYAYPPASGERDQMYDGDDTGSNYSGYSRGSSHVSHRGRDAAPSANGHNQKPHGRRATSSNFDGERDDFGSSANGSIYDAGLTTGSSSGGSYENGESEKRTYKLSHTVPTETWEKAIAAVEQQGMSLRSAAKMYGVHFAALHRRVKKRAQGEQASGIEGYFQPDDEAGIIRVVVARAELGVLMTFDELMDLVQRAALRNLPDLSVEAARKLMTRFQTRNEHSIRHIITDWPLPRANPITSVPRVVNNHDGAPRGMSNLSISSSASSSSARRLPLPLPQSPPGLQGYPPARSNQVVLSEPPLARIHQQPRVEMHHSPLPSLGSDFALPGPPASVFSRHTLHNNVSPQPLRVPQPMPSSAVADHLASRYVNHADPRDHLRYDEQDGDSERRDSGSSDGDAVMFV